MNKKENNKIISYIKNNKFNKYFIKYKNFDKLLKKNLFNKYLHIIGNKKYHHIISFSMQNGKYNPKLFPFTFLIVSFSWHHIISNSNAKNKILLKDLL